MPSRSATFGRGYLRRVLVAATSILCVAVLVSGPAAFAADSSDPTFTLTPAMGPPGTHVTISGRLTSAQIPVWAPMLNNPGFFALVTDLSSGCELVGAVTNETIHLDAATGRVTGSFVVGGTGICTMSDPDAATHSAPPGRYQLAISCAACQVATFTLTKPAATLPATGFPIAGVGLGACGLLVLGLLLRSRGRQPRSASL